MKNFIFFLLFAVSLFSEYLDDKSLKTVKIDYFVGGMYSFNYLKSSDSIDNLDYTYGGYIGVRNSDDYEFIIQKSYLDANDYKIDLKYFRVNIPLSSLYTKRLYLGFGYGSDDFKFKQKIIDNIDVSNKKDSSGFYSIAFGKRYKFAKFFYVRIEGEYMKFNNSINITQNKNFTLNSSINFNYFVEYCF